MWFQTTARETHWTGCRTRRCARFSSRSPKAARIYQRSAEREHDWITTKSDWKVIITFDWTTTKNDGTTTKNETINTRWFLCVVLPCCVVNALSTFSPKRSYVFYNWGACFPELKWVWKIMRVRHFQTQVSLEMRDSNSQTVCLNPALPNSLEFGD